MYVYTCMYVCMYICIYVCKYVCMKYFVDLKNRFDGVDFLHR